MNFKKIHMYHVQAAAVVLLAQVPVAHAAESVDMPPVFTFATGYKVDTPVARNYVEYGVVKKCGKAWCVTVERYDSEKLLPRVPTRYIHEMKAPYGGVKCTNGPISRVAKDLVYDQKTEVRTEGGDIYFRIKDWRYHWAVDKQAPNGYKLVEIVSETTRSSLDQAVGFAFASDQEVIRDVTAPQIAMKYKGEIYAKTAFTRVEGEWDLKPSIIDFRLFTPTDNGAVLTLTQPGIPAIVQKYGGPMWVQNSIVLTRDRATIAPLVQEYGHDFNRDGCFNESGHNKMMLPIAGSDGSIREIVYIEYTSDFQRGFPMMSVGRYYR